MYVWITTPASSKLGGNKKVAPHDPQDKPDDSKDENEIVVSKRDLRSVDLLEDDMMHHDKAEWFGEEKIEVAGDGKLLVTELDPHNPKDDDKSKKRSDSSRVIASTPGAKKYKDGTTVRYYRPAKVEDDATNTIDGKRVLKYERIFYQMDTKVQG